MGGGLMKDKNTYDGGQDREGMRRQKKQLDSGTDETIIMRRGRRKEERVI